MFQRERERLIEVYFSQQSRQLTIEAGVRLMTQNGFNDRLYWVKSGELKGYYESSKADLSLKPGTELFTVSPGEIVGVHSFFSRSTVASTTIIASQDSELGWIDLNTEALEPELYGALSDQLMPLIVDELARRQQIMVQQTAAKERAMQKLFRAEQMTTLGQLAAGIAHELNNAVGVLSSKTETLQQSIYQRMVQRRPHLCEYLEHGLNHGQQQSSAEVRQRAKYFAQQYGLEKGKAKQLARAWPEDEIPQHWLTHLDDALIYWDMGRDIHDMRLAATHATHIVRSVKQLGGGEQDKQYNVNVNDTIEQALSLLQSPLRRVQVAWHGGEMPAIYACQNELVQVWINIIKNGCDAMMGMASPQLEIQTTVQRKSIVVTISNNGPAIPEEVRRKIFQPNFTTKKGGLSFGLGLGLSIAQRIVQSYEGSIAVKSDDSRTTFRIKLPFEDSYG
ncbi:ATP-binding protein [Vibrio stylophorae]|uniref:ATP-binding protein n=1 Tax=Vibrio stylophorae TaxID=659351 RepID=UPI001F28D082|nr:ATP-binding protein [Vibrio stylophorae]